MGGSFEPDIRVFVNRDCAGTQASPRWYFGVDGRPPAGHIDFVSVVLHEIGHGLGISGAGRVTSGEGTVRYSTRPYAYDRFTVDGTMDFSPLLAYPDFSSELGTVLQSGSGGVLYGGASAITANGGEPPSLYAPDPWTGGSSYSHLDEQTYDGTTDALMTPILGTMEANHVVGPVSCGLLEDMGWTVSFASCDVSLPVELVEFEAIVDGTDVVLSWRTAVEHDNVGFDIEHRAEGSDFAQVAFEPGAGNTSSGASYRHALVDPGPGRHAYRLRQIDLDGSSTYSEVVEVSIESRAAFELGPAFPNPFAESTRLTLGVQRSQHVVVTVFDMLGRTVEVLFSDLVPANSRIPLYLDGGSLSSGVYVVHVEGETSVENRSIVRLR